MKRLAVAGELLEFAVKACVGGVLGILGGYALVWMFIGFGWCIVGTVDLFR